MPQLTEAETRVQTSRWRALHIGILIALCVTNLLLPIDVGFPLIKVGGLPLRITMVVSFFGLGVLAALHPTALKRAIRTKYIVAQAVFLLCLLLGCLRSDLFALGFVTVSSYATNYIVDWLILFVLFQFGYERWFTTIAATTVTVAAAIGIVEGITHVRISAYEGWFEASARVGAITSNLDYLRVIGTLGNSIIYASTLLLVLPIVSRIRSAPVRFGIYALVVAAAVFTVSRTIFLIAIPLLLGSAVIVRGKLVMVSAIVAILLGVFSGPLLEVATESSLTGRWVLRLSDQRNVNTRSAALEAVFKYTNDPSEVVFGHGLKAETVLGDKFFGGIQTVDNTYASIFYDMGLVGLILYLNATLGVLWRARRQALTNPAFYGVLGVMGAGFSFVTYFYFTTNFVVAALFATVWYRHTVALASATAAHDMRENSPGTTLQPAS